MSHFTNHKILWLALAFLCLSTSAWAQDLPSFTKSNDVSIEKGQFLPAVSAWHPSDPMSNANIFTEDFEVGTSNWKMYGTDWQINNGRAEAINYQNNSSSYLISPAFTLADGKYKLKYKEKYALESSQDFGSVWISTDEGAHWRKVHTVTGVADWRDTYIDLRAYQNQKVQFAFLLNTDETVSGDGWQIDALEIVEAKRDFVKSNSQARTTATAITQALEGPLNAILTSRETNTFPSISANIRVEGLSNLVESNFVAYENDEEQTEDFNVVLPQGGTFRPADIVFIIDNSGSMSPFQLAIQNSVNDFVNNLFDAGVDAALGLTRFGQSSGFGTPIVEENGTLFTDPDVFLNSIFNRNTDNGSYEPGLDAILASASAFNFRPNAQKIFILMTDEEHNPTSTQASDVLPVLQQNTITLFSIIDSDYLTSQEDYGDLAINSGGQQFEVFDLFDPETLEPIIDSIEEGIATNDTYIVSYTSSNPTLDGIERVVDIVVSVESEMDTVTFTYTPGGAPTLSLANSTLNLIQNAQPEGIPLTIQANITDFEEPFVQSATLFYKNTDATSYSSIIMTNTGGDLWEASIPASIAIMPGVDFYITATDGVTTTSDRPDSPAQNPYQIAINPNVAPQITSTPIISLSAGEDLKITANISDNTNEVASASLFYRGIGEPLYKEVTLTNNNGDTYEATVDAALLSQNGVQYYIKATDNFGISAYFGEPQNPIEVEIVPTNQPSLVLSPANITVYANQEVCVIAEYKDQNGDPISEESVSFEVSGVNEISGTVETDENGLAEFCYTPENLGEDILTASADGLSDNTVITIEPDNGNNQLVITAFNLIDAESDVMIQTINDGDQVLLASLSTNMFSIEAITNPVQVGSVSFSLEGPFTHEQIESKSPYAIFGDTPQGNFNGRLLPPGEYTLTAIPYSEANAQGLNGTPLEVGFTILGEEVPSDLQVTDFDLYDAVTNKKLIALKEGSVINLQLLENDELTILINSMPDFVGSVMLELNGPVSNTRIENTKPYAVFKNNSTELFGETFVPGDYTISATPYTEKNAQGIAGSPLEVNFSIIDEEPDLLITDFDLYDAVTDQKILDIAEGSEIALNELENNYLTLLINVMPDFVGSVKLELSGPVSSMRIENTSPYAVFRNDDNDLFGANFVPGDYTMTATPYSEKNAQGIAGSPLEVNFSMVDESLSVARKASKGKKGDASETLQDMVLQQEDQYVAYPVPFKDQLFIKTSAEASTLDVTLYSLDGKAYPVQVQQAQGNIEVKLSERMSSGLYMLRVVSGNQLLKTLKVQKE